MTTIAWDGNTLAADRKCVSGGTPYRVTKIFRIKRDGRHLLVGMSGDQYMATAWRRWMNGDAGMEPIGGAEYEKLIVMVIDEKKRIWSADLRKVYDRTPMRCWAIGSGADYALAAMTLGRSAANAVRLAAKLDNGTGFGVDTLEWRRK